MVTPITSTQLQGEYHELRGADGRIILLADVLPEHAALIVKAVNAYREWQPIESAPRDGSVIWLYLAGEGYHGPRRCDITTGVWTDSGWYVIADGYAGVVSDQPTHWMPLPAAPEPALTEPTEAK